MSWSRRPASVSGVSRTRSFAAAKACSRSATRSELSDFARASCNRSILAAVASASAVASLRAARTLPNSSSAASRRPRNPSAIRRPSAAAASARRPSVVARSALVRAAYRATSAFSSASARAKSAASRAAAAARSRNTRPHNATASGSSFAESSAFLRPSSDTIVLTKASRSTWASEGLPTIVAVLKPTRCSSATSRLPVRVSSRVSNTAPSTALARSRGTPPIFCCFFLAEGLRSGISFALVSSPR